MSESRRVPLYIETGTAEFGHNPKRHAGYINADGEGNLTIGPEYEVESAILSMVQKGTLHTYFDSSIAMDGPTGGPISVTLKAISAVPAQPAAKQECEHHWISQHKPDHLVYWVRICSVCHEPDWDDLDREIRIGPAGKEAEIKVDPCSAEIHEGQSHLQIRTWDRWLCANLLKDMFANYEPQPEEKAMPSDVHDVESQNIKNQDIQYIIRTIVYDYAKEHLDKSDDHRVGFTLSSVYIVWFGYILGNWKALVSTNLLDGMYYEVTYDVDEECAYLDAYKKFENVRIDMGSGIR